MVQKIWFIAQQFHGKVVYQSGIKSKPIILTGSIVDSPDHYRYVDYLIRKLTDFRQRGASLGQSSKGKIHSGGTRKILENEFGNLPKDLPLTEFDKLVDTLKAKIDNTALGRYNHARGVRNYHTFEEHGKKGKD